MKLLQRYIFWETSRVFASVLVVLTVLLVFVGVFQQVSESGLGPAQIFRILPFIVPSLLPFTIPATLLLTVCVVYGRISGDQEITAAKAAGINVLSLMWPAFFLGAVMSVCALMLTDQVIPWSVKNIQRIITLAMEDIFLDVLRRQSQISDPQHGVVITVMGVEGKRLIRPTFRYTPKGGEAVMVQAQEATIEFDLASQEVIFHMIRGHIDIPGQRRAWFAKQSRPFPLDSRMPQVKPRHLSIRELRNRVAKLDREHQAIDEHRMIEAAMAMATGEFSALSSPEHANEDTELEENRKNYYRTETEVHSRFALSSSCFFFVLLGTPFSIIQARKQFLTAFILVFGPILLFYYPMVLGAMNLSKTGVLEPQWGMWIPNLIMLVVGLFVLRKSLQH